MVTRFAIPEKPFENFIAEQEKGGLLDQRIKIVDTGQANTP
jgi:hypothetical protein